MFIARSMFLSGMLLAAAAGEETTEPPADFTQGFKHLAALGLPALDETAKWSVLSQDHGDDYRYRELTQTLKGNGWCIPGQDGQFLALRAGQVQVNDLKATNMERPRGLFSRMFGSGAKAATAAPEADLAKDVKSLLAALDKAGRENEFNYISSSDQSPGRVLLLATQIYQNKQPALANQLAAALFDVVPSREMVVDSAVTIMADDAYNTAAMEFFNSSDWTAYHESAKSLLEKFPRGWSSREAVAMMLPQLAKQAAGSPPAVPALPGVTFDPRVLEAVKSLTEKPAADAKSQKTINERLADYGPMGPQEKMRVLLSLRSENIQQLRYGTPWLLQPASAARNRRGYGGMGSGEPAGNSPVLRLTEHGMAALPVLAALVEDPYFTYVPNLRNEGSSYFSSRETDGERIMRAYAQLNRPATRGEIACALLQCALPNPSDRSETGNPSDLRDAALAFWKEHQNSTRDQLVLTFLRNGSSNQSREAAQLLATAKDPAAHKAFEEFALAADPAIQIYQTVQIYLSNRKGAGKPFFDAYAKLVRSQAQDGGGNDDPFRGGSSMHNPKQQEKMLKLLENLVAGTSPKTLVRQIAQASPDDAGAAISQLVDMMADKPAAEGHALLLEGALLAKKPEVRGMFLTYMMHREGGDDDTSVTGRKLDEKEIQAWRELLADKADFANRWSGQQGTIGDHAAQVLEASFGGARDVTAAAPILRKTATELFHERAAARLAGQTLPKLPDAAQVKPERLRAIVAEAARKPPLEVHPYLATLTADERAAWKEWLDDPGDVPVPESLDKLRKMIVQISTEIPQDWVRLDVSRHAGEGFVVDGDNLDKLVTSLAADAANLSRTYLVLWTAEFGPGLRLAAATVPWPEKDNEMMVGVFNNTVDAFDADDPPDAVITVGTHRSQDAVIPVKAGKAKLKNDDGENVLTPVLTAMDQAGADQAGINIRILAKPDAAKIKTMIEKMREGPGEEDSEEAEESPKDDADAAPQDAPEEADTEERAGE